MKNFDTLHSCTVRTDTCDCFTLLSLEEMALIEENQVEIKYKKGEVLCKQGTFEKYNSGDKLFDYGNKWANISDKCSY